MDNVVTIPVARLGRTVGFLTDAQERDLAEAAILAFDLDVPFIPEIPILEMGARFYP